jgi:hypothetical protein
MGSVISQKMLIINYFHLSGLRREGFGSYLVRVLLNRSCNYGIYQDSVAQIRNPVARHRLFPAISGIICHRQRDVCSLTREWCFDTNPDAIAESGP